MSNITKEDRERYEKGLRDVWREQRIAASTEPIGANEYGGTILRGDDLTSEMLDALYAHVGIGDPESTMAGWWENKPHQLAARLICRLTRAEAAVDRLTASLMAANAERDHLARVLGVEGK